MSGWEEELAVLLQGLGVKQEEPQPRRYQVRKPMHSDVKRHDLSADALTWENDADFDDDTPFDDLELMRHEVNAIVSQVILLMQHGDLEASLKEDAMVVLRALRHRIPQTQSINDEAYLESASAILHFCRLVLQLTEATSEEI